MAVLSKVKILFSSYLLFHFCFKSINAAGGNGGFLWEHGDFLLFFCSFLPAFFLPFPPSLSSLPLFLSFPSSPLPPSFLSLLLPSFLPSSVSSCVLIYFFIMFYQISLCVCSGNTVSRVLIGSVYQVIEMQHVFPTPTFHPVLHDALRLPLF